MWPGLGEWQLGVKSLKPNIHAQTVSRIPCRHFVLCKEASKTKIHVDISVLVSVVVILSTEWWSVPTTADDCEYIP